jgi:hypothetical protein
MIAPITPPSLERAFYYGFDASLIDTEHMTLHICCSDCDAKIIDGKPMHEITCPKLPGLIKKFKGESSEEESQE